MKRQRPCRAAEPENCQYHGKNTVGPKANAVIQSVLTTPPRKYHLTNEELKTYPLKKMNATALALALRNFARDNKEVDESKIVSVIKLASDLHQVDTRSNRGKYQVTPYIEHPLRNTLRLTRYGCKDEQAIFGSILHDTVEDHPFEMSERFAGKKAETEEEARVNCYEYIAKTYGSETAAMVKGMSNPILPKYMPAAQKNKLYAEHVAEAIKDNPRVFMGKICDLVDNAVGLHHNLKGGMSPVSVKKKATKYLLVWSAVEAEFERNKHTLPVTPEGLAAIENHLKAGRKSLEKLSQLEV